MGMGNVVLCDVTLFDSCENGCFLAKYHLHHKGERNQRAGNDVSSNKQLPKRRFLQEPQGVTSQKMTFFRVTAVKHLKSAELRSGKVMCLL
jgi:hypothetical protein